ncbi:hypothetical protein C8J30_101542 [Rhodobacter viridis]|uniref:ParB-like nuclease family protein n=1 Tax=Rhodobacter viridis TaxID=1054202 RepID=A0A318UHR6_9RHOB|nr:hypothetical protein [Rhodobacter viridis]PYF13155.1 hypothetical protein C8J30_101542 [Rhodobacter viridis]
MTMMQPITAKPGSVATSVSLDQITESAEFSFRSGGTDGVHAADLASTIRNTGGALDPVLLWQTQADEIGAEGVLILLDGAHRLAAYRSVQWSQPIPAIILIGMGRREALGAALKANSKRTRGLSQVERMDAAWRLVREPEKPRYKVREIAAWADVAGSTVDNMRARFKVMHEEGIEITGSWAWDRRTRVPGAEDEVWQLSEAQRNAEIDKLAGDLRDLLDRRKNPDRLILREEQAIWEAICVALGENTIKHMFGYLLGSEEAVDDWAALRKASEEALTLRAEDDDPEPQF